MRLPVLAGALAIAVPACGGGHTASPDAGGTDGAVDAAPQPWWQPKPGDARNWDIQLAAPIDVSAARAMYDLDLFALVPAATMIDYGDGDPVTVPAGALAGKLAELHARTPPAIVICHVDTGALELGRPDARKFPGYEASPPDRPTAPKAGSVIGWSATTKAERYLDLRAASRSKWAPLVYKRLDLAVQLGCDGIDGDRNDSAGSDPGFAITADDQRSWYEDLATQAHMRKLSIGMRDSIEIPGFADQLAPMFDWAVIQRCAEYDDCDTPRPFINLHKAVFAIDYQLDNTDPQNPTGVDPVIACPRYTTAMIQDGLVKDGILSSAFRVQCTP